MDQKKMFRDDWAFLSNFHETPVKLAIAGMLTTLPTGEHAFQAFKIEATDMAREEKREWLTKFENAETPEDAKKLGRKIPIDIDTWNEAASYYMWISLLMKFTQHSDLKDKLLATNKEKLVEYNTWGDKLWGVDIETGKGKNLLGKLLMKLRSELRDWPDLPY